MEQYACDELDSLYQAARRARDNRSYEDAAKYYETIQAKDPTSWEAKFYATCCRAQMCPTAQIESSVVFIQNRLSSVFLLISTHMQGEDAQIAAHKEVALYVLAVADTFCSASKRSFELNSKTLESHKVMMNQLFALYELLSRLGNSLTLSPFIPRDSQLDDLAVIAWKRAVDYTYHVWFSFLRIDIVKYANTSEAYALTLQMVNLLVPGILARDPNYENPFDTGIKPGQSVPVQAPSSSSSSGGGCYVATAVYGSYDCPQVWTLRRFRDYTLSKTWYGRAFIRTYYAISPTLVKWFGHTGWFKRMWKGKLDRLVVSLNAGGVEDTPYEDQCW